ncbi:MAG: 6-phosphofructokinase, partial [Burkholderiales bacterium]|nr:6-phosphofructokinase [Burkholderiales bacterium]
KSKLGIQRVRGDTFGYLQRSFLGCVSDVDQREARQAGVQALRFALGGDRDGSVAITRRVGDDGGYAAHYDLVALESVAAKTRVMDDAFIAPAGNDVTEAFGAYLRPLLGSDLPAALKLRAAAVRPVLNSR